jgi:hypothetical protein
MNSAQYHQACPTPFGSGPLAVSMGRHGNTPTAKALLGGKLPNRALNALFPEAVRILSTLATPCPTLAGTSDITHDAFIAAYKVTPESTSSLPSGRHVGHYKAILSFPDLVTLHASMMSIPFKVGFTADHWNKVVDIMLPKDADLVRCHRLRIIALLESDYNQAKWILIGRCFTHHMEDSNLLPSMQYGSRPGCQCQSSVLKKVLAHDIVRITKTTAAFLEVDAIGCYNRLVNSFVL